MFLGKCGDYNCRTGKRSANKSICITGMSGYGKTTRLNVMELEAAKEGKTVIVLDLNNTHDMSRIFTPIKELYETYARRIDVNKMGLNLRILTQEAPEEGIQDPFERMTDFAVEVLSVGQNIGSEQMVSLRKAVIYAIENYHMYSDELEAIKTGLLLQNTRVSNSVYQKLRWLFRSDALHKNHIRLEEGKINILDFDHFGFSTRQSLSEIFLACLWKKVQNIHTNSEIVLFLDEFQNLSLKKDATLKAMLCEGRKYGLSIVLSTQTLDGFSKNVASLVNQTATRLYFHPSRNEIRRIAKEIDPDNAKEWIRILSHLQVGQSVAVGSLNVNNNEMDRPIIIS